MQGQRTRREVLRLPERPRPAVNVVLWEERRRPDEATLRARLVAEGYEAVRWRSEPDQAYVPHAHIYPERMWVVSGSLTVVLPEGKRLLELEAGDRIDLPAGMVHAVLAGADGATFLIGTHTEG